MPDASGLPPRQPPALRTARVRDRLWPFPAPVWGMLGLAVLLSIWEAVPRLGLVPIMLLPPPSAIPAAFWGDVASGEWQRAIFASLGHYTMGLAIGSIGGIVLGVAAGASARTDAALAYVVRILRPIPGLAWVPFAIIWFGVSTGAATFIVAVGVFWINFFAALSAVQAVDRDLVEVADAFGHGGFFGRLFKVILPAASPAILGGLRTGLGQAWMAVVAAELFGVPGLGQRMMQASSLLAIELVVVYMLTMAALYGAIDWVFVKLRDRLLRWKP
jgi:NitT/TauT family transport system permease protein